MGFLRIPNTGANEHLSLRNLSFNHNQIPNTLSVLKWKGADASILKLYESFTENKN